MNFLFLFHVVPLTLHSHRNRFPACWGTFLSSPRVARKEERADHLAALAGELTFPMKQNALFHSIRFHLSLRKGAITKDLLLSLKRTGFRIPWPHHCISPALRLRLIVGPYSKQLRQRGTSPVQFTNHFSQVIPPSTRLADNVNHTRIIRNSNKGWNSCFI